MDECAHSGWIIQRFNVAKDRERKKKFGFYFVCYKFAHSLILWPNIHCWMREQLPIASPIPVTFGFFLFFVFFFGIFKWESVISFEIHITHTRNVYVYYELMKHIFGMAPQFRILIYFNS